MLTKNVARKKFIKEAQDSNFQDDKNALQAGISFEPWHNGWLMEG